MARLAILALSTCGAWASKFQHVTLRGSISDEFSLNKFGELAKPGAAKVATLCAILAVCVTFCLYHYYADAILRSRPQKEAEDPKEVEKAREPDAAATPALVRPERKKASEKPCCCGGLKLLQERLAGRTDRTPKARPNFSGSWKCVGADGDLDGLYASMGLGYFARCAMERLQWGKGQLTRTYEHQGEHVKLTQRAADETTQEFDISGQPQKVQQGDGVVIQTTCWDEKEEGVLIMETKDLLGCKPKTWTTTRQYLQDNQLVVEVLGADGHRATWTYQRED